VRVVGHTDYDLIAETEKLRAPSRP
jgi:hypothetical protein